MEFTSKTLRLARILNEFPEREIDEQGELNIYISTAEYLRINNVLLPFTDGYYLTQGTPEALDDDNGLLTLTLVKSYDITDLILAGFDVIGMTAFYKDAEKKPNKEFIELLSSREKNLARKMIASVIYDEDVTKIIRNTNEARMIFYSDERAREVYDLYKLAGGDSRGITFEQFEVPFVVTIRSFKDFEELLVKDATILKKTWAERAVRAPREIEVEYYDRFISALNRFDFIKAREAHCIIAETSDEPFDFNMLHFANKNLELNGSIEMAEGGTYIVFRGEVTLTTLKALGLAFEGQENYPEITQVTIDVESFYNGGINDREKPKNYYGDRGNGGRQL